MWCKTGGDLVVAAQDRILKRSAEDPNTISLLEIPHFPRSLTGTLLKF